MPTRRLIIVVGPSGAGKDTVLRGWRRHLAETACPGPASATHPDLAAAARPCQVHFAQRLVTRPADPAGEAHEPVSPAALAALREQGELAFGWQANGLEYAVRRQALAPLARGDWVVVNGSREHLAQLRRQAPGCRVVEITAPAELLSRRLAGRGREQAAEVQARLQRRPAPAQADLQLLNVGDAADCVQALHRWWRSLG